MRQTIQRLAVAIGLVVVPRLVPAAEGPNLYGTTAVSYLRVPSGAFFPVLSDYAYSTDGFMSLRYATVSGTFDAPVTLPAGAKIVSMRFEFSDEDAGGSIKASLLVCRYAELCSEHPDAGAGPADCILPGKVCSGNAFASGIGLQTADLTPDALTIDNLNATYLVRISPSTPQRKIGGVVIGYLLQVSPPPATATFGDVPSGDTRFQFVEALVAAGITAGCGNGDYCPDAPLTRGQMAVFLAKALGLQWP